ncbi:MAG: CAP domain-containing protein [Candidatus Aminicenantes bacterium]|nr:MAG: CAP domain-containing protein [Candidatus Aminicenantes bacterium]
MEDIYFLSDLEKEIIIELNRARTNPAGYAKKLEDFKRHYFGKYIYFAGRTQVITQEGASAVNEAIEFLRSTAPVPLLRVSRGLSAAAKAHAADQGPKGLVSHVGTDKSTPDERMNRFGKWGTAFGENIEFGNFTAPEIVMQLIINDGVPERSHRKNIFNPLYQVVGVSFGPHYSYSHMCVMDFAGTYKEEN